MSITIESDARECTTIIITTVLKQRTSSRTINFVVELLFLSLVILARKFSVSGIGLFLKSVFFNNFLILFVILSRNVLNTS